MKKLYSGFTLAEVLLTLSILGVVAAMTLPGLKISIDKQQSGPAFAKAINTLEIANSLALSLQQGNARTLDQLTSTTKAYYFDEVLAPYVNWRKEPFEKSYYNYDMTALSLGTVSKMYTTKDGITFLREDNNVPTATTATGLGAGYSGKYYVVYIDTNGNRTAPNVMGKDLFKVYVDTKGTVIPHGGATYKEYFAGDAILWKTGCYSPKVTVSDAASCAGSIADNGFKVIY